jgi:hypothetical protein
VPGGFGYVVALWSLAEPDAGRSLSSGSAGCRRLAVPSPVLGDGEDLDVATVVLAADSPPSVLPITAVVAGFVLISHHSS